MQFLVKSDRTFVLHTETAATIPAEVARLTHIQPLALSLTSNGHALSTLGDLEGLLPGTTIHAGHRMLGGVAKKRCEQSDCSSPALRNLNCSLCTGQYCARHRLLEQHACSGLASCKDQMRRANQAKLESERCVAPKVI